MKWLLTLGLLLPASLALGEVADTLSGRIIDCQTGVGTSTVSIVASLQDGQVSATPDENGDYVLVLDVVTSVGEGSVGASWSQVKSMYGPNSGNRSIPSSRSHPSEDDRRWEGPFDLWVSGDDYMTVPESFDSINGPVERNYALVKRNWETSLGNLVINSTQEFIDLGEGKWFNYNDNPAYPINGGIFKAALEGRAIDVYFGNEAGYEGGWDQIIEGGLTRKEHAVNALNVLEELGYEFNTEGVADGEEDLRLELDDHFECPNPDIRWDHSTFGTTHWARVNVNANNTGIANYLGKEIYYQATAASHNSHGGIYAAEPGQICIEDIVSTNLMIDFLKQKGGTLPIENNLIDMSYTR